MCGGGGARCHIGRGERGERQRSGLIVLARFVALGATIHAMMMTEKTRVFKTAWFAKAARKVHIPDKELCAAILQIIQGQVDDLGGGVYKKRLRKNQYRSIILARADAFWVYEYVFAKQDRANIDDDELIEFRKLAQAYGRLTAQQVEQLLQNQDWQEICNDKQT
jgi:hypothetical protein